MSEKNCCPECGAPLPAYWPVALCSQCALLGAVGIEPGLEPGGAAVPAARSSGVPPPLESRSVTLTEPASEGAGATRPAFGDYELLEEIARGGMGVVYRARQLSLNRIVAVKMILSGQFASKQEVLRFRSEAEAAAHLRHPNIVAIHETGEHDGQNYFSMEFVAGRSLSEIVRAEGPLPARRAARYVQIIARAIEHAHAQGILHRDLKPSNVLIDANDEPRVTDFGLAKRLRGDFGLTVTGQILGSPNFMPPEQTGARSGRIGPWTDVYGLGAILYHLLTGRAPFEGESLDDVLTQLREREPVLPRLLRPGVPRDLETICLKCLEKEPSRRYPTALEVAEELQHFLADEPILARPTSAMEKLWRWCRRRPAVAGSVGIAAAALVAGLAATTWQWRRAEAIARSEHEQRERAEAQAYVSDMNRAQQALAEHDLGRASHLLDRYQPKRGVVDLRGWEWRNLWQRCRGDMEFTLLERPGFTFFFVGFVNQDTRLVTFDNRGRIELWDLATRLKVGTLQDEILKHNETGNSGQACLSNDGELLAARSATATGGQSIKIWRTRTGEILSELRCELGLASSMAFSPDQRRLAAFLLHHTARVWDLATGKIDFETPVAAAGNSDRSTHGAVQFSPDGTLLAIGDGDGRVRFVALPTRTEQPGFQASTEGIFTLAFSPNGRTIAAASGYRSALITIWDVSHCTNQMTLKGHRGWVPSLAFSPNGRTLASAGGDGMVKLWDTGTWKERMTLDGHTESAASVAFTRDGGRLATGGNRAVNLWSADTRRSVHGALVVPSVGRAWDAAPDLSAIVFIRDGMVQLRKLGLNPSERPIPALGTNNVTVAWDALGAIVAGSQNPPEFKVWNPTTAALTAHSLEGRGSASRWLFLPRSRTMVIGGTNDAPNRWTFTQWDVRGFVPASELVVNAELPWQYMGLATSPDERVLMLGAVDGVVSLFDLTSRRALDTLKAHREIVQIMALLPGRRFLATAGEDTPEVIKVWDLNSRREVRRLLGHTVAVTRVVLTSDGSRMASSSIGREPIRIWDTRTWDEVAQFVVDDAALTVARFLPSDDTLAATDEHGTLYLWRAPSLDRVALAEKDRPGSREAP